MNQVDNTSMKVERRELERYTLIFDLSHLFDYSVIRVKMLMMIMIEEIDILVIERRIVERIRYNQVIIEIKDQ